MRKRLLQCVMLTMLILCCCTGEKEIEVKHAPGDVMQLYLEALKKQDGLTMAEYTLDHNGVDFSINDEDAKAWGLHKDSMRKLYEQPLNFNYTSDEAVISDSNAEITLHVQAYDIQKVLKDIAAKKEERFQEINGDDMSEKEKNKKIADIIIAEFKNAKRTRQFDVVFHLQLTEDEWLIQPQDEAMLLEQLFMPEKGA